MIIAIDIDETIYPLMNDWIDLYRAKTGHNLVFDDFKTYGIHNTMDQLPREQVYGLLDFIKYERMAYANATRVITELGLAGHRIVFHSTVHNMRQAEFKMAFLRRNFVRFNWDVVFGHGGINKMQYVKCADIIIEDSPENATYVLSHYSKNAAVILLNKPYTKEAPNHPRIFNTKNWFDITKILDFLGA